MKAASKSLDLIMNTVSATHDYNAYQRLLRVDGKVQVLARRAALHRYAAARPSAG